MGDQLKPPRLVLDCANGRAVGYGTRATLGQMASSAPAHDVFGAHALPPSNRTQPIFIFLVDLYEMDVTYIYSRPTDVGQLGIYGKSIQSNCTYCWLAMVLVHTVWSGWE